MWNIEAYHDEILIHFYTCTEAWSTLVQNNWQKLQKWGSKIILKTFLLKIFMRQNVKDTFIHLYQICYNQLSMFIFWIISCRLYVDWEVFPWQFYYLEWLLTTSCLYTKEIRLGVILCWWKTMKEFLRRLLPQRMCQKLGN